MKVLFLASCSSQRNLYNDACVRYRCFNPAVDLVSERVVADVCHVAEFSSKFIDWYDVFIFCRPVYENECKNVIKLLKKQNKIIVADYDDLLFGKENAVHSPRYINKSSSERFIFSANKHYTEALKYFDFFTVSTEPLAQHIIKLKPEAKCCVVHNGVSKRWFDLAISVESFNKEQIGYFAGGACHNADFQSITPALRQFLENNSNSTLYIPEMLSVDDGLKQNDQLECFGKMHFLQLPEAIAKCAVNIAPLLENEFNRCKSAIKFLESAAAGVPVIASPIPDFKRFSSTGLRFAKTHQDWINHLSLFMDRRGEFQDELRDCVYSEGMSLPQSIKLLTFLQEVLGA